MIGLGAKSRAGKWERTCRIYVGTREKFMPEHPSTDEERRGTRHVMMGAVIFCFILIAVIFGWFVVLPHGR